MTVQFSEYTACLGATAETHREALESACNEAARVMSPRGLQNYLEGMRALSSLGRNSDLVLSYVEEMPAVVREVGEDVLPDVIGAAMKLSSLTSATVVSLLIANLPLAARRLGDADVLRSFLGLVHQLAGKAPRGLRPMMANLDELLSKLTLGGLRRWAMWGAQAHQRDLEGQIAYFGLATETSRSVLQKERRGTLFVDNQRKLNFYLRALWNRSFFMRPTSGDYESRQGLRPYIEDRQFHLPDAFDSFQGIEGLQIYRAAVAHLAAHVIYTRRSLASDSLSPAQMKFVELFEDARVESAAMGEFPGLKKLWAHFFDVVSSVDGGRADSHPVARLMLHMADSLMNGHVPAKDPQVDAIAAAFVERIGIDPFDSEASRRAGTEFHDLLAGRMAMPGLGYLEWHAPPYRDDNRYVWRFDSYDSAFMSGDCLPVKAQQVRRYVSAVEMANEVDCELAGDDAQEIWVCATELFPYEDQGASFNDMWGKEPVSEPCHYHEWDYQAQLFRPDWVTVVERRQRSGDPAVMDAIVDRHKSVAGRIRYIIDALQPQGIVRRRGYEEGEELDLDAVVRAMTDIRRGVMPDTRINTRITRHLRDLAVILLLDLSESTNEPVDKADPEGASILSLTRDAAGLLAHAMDAIGDPFAVHGFASNGRHDVHYYRFKDFDERYDVAVRGRLAGMCGGLSTRMGAGLRHAGAHLSQHSCGRRLVLLVTDGEPADIDERDPRYLRDDARKAVEDLMATGVYVYCLTLDPQADRYVARIFGENNFAVVDHVERLPERLPAVFAALTR